jgi:hypothetical protein
VVGASVVVGCVVATTTGKGVVACVVGGNVSTVVEGRVGFGDSGGGMTVVHGPVLVVGGGGVVAVAHGLSVVVVGLGVPHSVGTVGVSFISVPLLRGNFRPQSKLKLLLPTKPVIFLTSSALRSGPS